MINRKKILIVEDDPFSIDFFDLMLSKLGFAVEKAGDGQEALKKIEETAPDLILLETVLPKVSGWKVLESVRRNPKTEMLPILLLSQIDDVKDIVEGFELGADDYILKPFSFSVVLARIRAALRSRVLISELSARESRLALSEKLQNEIEKNLKNFQKGIAGICNSIEAVKKDTKSTRAIKDMEGNINDLNKHIKALEMNFSNLQNEWAELKQKEIDLPILKKPIRNPVS
ncbi:MAG: response regulator [Spirochaetaceae bacterium]|jgi:DNA-binding response OmpR family regulator|nr:response regulator [Spirochaetaceae bacterium]